MTIDLAVDWFRKMLWAAILSAGPAVFTLVVVGLIIAIIQAATQVNDQAVSFGPKALALVVALSIAGPWMLQQLSEFASAAIIAIGHINR